jgi:hypothetical protein
VLVAGAAGRLVIVALAVGAGTAVRMAGVRLGIKATAVAGTGAMGVARRQALGSRLKIKSRERNLARVESVIDIVYPKVFSQIND